MDYLSKAIFNLKPNAEFSFVNDDYSTIKWDVLEGNAPTQNEIDVEINRIKSAEITDAQTKATARQAILDRLGLSAEEAQLLLGGN